MISCTECKNSGYCPFWKGEKANLRVEASQEYPINQCLQMGVLVHKGIDIATICKKFQKNIFSV